MNVVTDPRILCLALTVACAAPGARPPAAGGRPSTGGLREAWRRPIPSGFPMSIAVGGAHVYVAAKEGGVRVLDARNGSEVARLGPDAFDGLDPMALDLRGERLYVALGTFFPREGSRAGLGIVDVGEPRSPAVVSTWATDERIGGAAGVLVAGDRAYLAAMEKGVLVLDVSDERAVRRTGSFRPDPDFPRPDPNATRRPNARGMALAGGLLYLAYDAGGLRVLDVSDPSRIREVGRYLNAGPGKKQQAYNAVALDGTTLYAALDYCGMEILDVRDPAAIRPVGWWNPWGCDRLSNVWANSAGHANHVAVDPARELVFLSAGDSELQVVDVSDPARPRRAAAWGEPKNGRAAWGMTLDGGRVYLAYVRAFVPFRGTWSGVVALDR